MTPLVGELFTIFEKHYPQSMRSITEAREVNPQRFYDIAEMLLNWAIQTRGTDVLPIMADAFVRFTFDINMAQARYEADGHYACQSFDEVNIAVYGESDFMGDYLWGSYLSNILWAHHVEIGLFFRDRFIERLPDDATIIEIAPGHGTWGLWALHEKAAATLEGFDISPAAVALANEVAEATGFGDRATYTVRNALDLASVPAASVDAVICSFLAEHLEDPGQLFTAVRHLLKPSGVAYVSAALTAAQVDHIYEFKHESELLIMCENSGLRAVETRCTAPRRTLPNAKRIPRSMGIIVQPNNLND